MKRQVLTASAASAVLHIVALAALAWTRWEPVTWEQAVDAGQPITLTFVSGSSENPAPTPPELTTFDLQQVPEPEQPVEPVSEVVVARVARETPVAEVAQRSPLSQTPHTSQQPQPPRRRTDGLLAQMQPAESLPTTRLSRTAKPIPLAPTLEPQVALLTAMVDDPGARVEQRVRQPVFNPAPDYPLEARRDQQEGRVVLLVHLDASGQVVRVVLRQSSGWPLLDDAARETVSRWRFAPATPGGATSPSQLLVPIRFSLRQ
jgi:protein TonB